MTGRVRRAQRSVAAAGGGSDPRELCGGRGSSSGSIRESMACGSRSGYEVCER